jgi:hypothetical protein
MNRGNGMDEEVARKSLFARELHARNLQVLQAFLRVPPAHPRSPTGFAGARCIGRRRKCRCLRAAASIILQDGRHGLAGQARTCLHP